MRYQLVDHGWPIGQWLIPAGTIIDLSKPDTQLTDFEKLAKGRVPPLNALALDPECVELMRTAYHSHHHLLRSDVTQWEKDIKWNAAVREVVAEAKKEK
jgi:hypothetical protein